MNLQGGGGSILVWIRSLPADTAPKRRGRQEERRQERDKKLAIGINSQLREESYLSLTEGAREGQRRAHAACTFQGSCEMEEQLPLYRGACRST